MDKLKAIGYALIVVGLFFGLEGTVFLFGSNVLLGELTELASLSAAYGADAAVYQPIQSMLGIVTVYAIAKTLAGITCIVLGYTAVTEKK